MTGQMDMDTLQLPERGQDPRSLTKEELAEICQAYGEKSYRAGQIAQWLHKKLVSGYDEMKNLPAALRSRLAADYPMQSVAKEQVLVSSIDGTRKYLFALADGNVIESVMMRYSFGISVCISTQAGCRMGCRFCASTLGGLARNLTPAEMLQQVYEIQKDVGERVSHVVLMGSGEPFDNFDAVMRFLDLITGEDGLHISARDITLSTCGLVPQMRYSMEEILDACRYYIRQTGRRVTFEYSLMGGINDSDRDARELAHRIAGMQAHVNLIPVNPVSERDFKSTGRDRAEGFLHTLEQCGVNATIRREMGRDINGACGQLRKSFLDRRERSGRIPAEDGAQ